MSILDIKIEGERYMHANDEIISLADFRKKLKRFQECYDEIYFRGEVEEFPNREPSILRDEGYLENEGCMYQEMMQMYGEQMKNAYRYIGKLALLQHNNVPTRLLDITVDPFVALYFACEQNGIANDKDGYVFMYIRNGKSCNSPDVYILSLHACFPELSYKEIAEKVWQELKVSYTEEKIQQVIHTPLFVKRSKDLSVGNSRIQAQKGCFFICADYEKGGLITLDSIPPVMIYRIPASYKAGIRDELDKEEKINVCSIYPEMPSGGAYLRAKYRTVRYEVSEKDYTVYDISQKTHCRRDTDLRIIVKEDLPIKWAKQIVRHVCEGYKSSSDVIWIYVGVSKEDMLLYNWRITGRWINPLWKNTGIDPLKERDGEFSWENQSGTSIISEYNEENVYKPDDELYVYYHQIFEDSMPYIREMFSLYANDEKEKLYTWISENKEQIQEFYNKTTNGCCSRIREWNEFIKHYSLLYIELNNICLVIENRNWNPQAKWHLVGRKIHSIQKEKDVIEKGEVKWRKTLDVTDEELKKYKPCYENHQVRSFTQTIPVSEDAIEVRMEIKYEKNTERKIIVSGKTNLFDGAQLLISITPDGKFYGPSCKVNCLNGTFTSVPLGNGTNLSGKCRLSITMPVSSVQPIEFVKKAGMQYENLKGDFIVRDGISPSGKYEQEVIL